jgi:ABC-type polysaccharide/polyol phosphate export permease
MVRSRVENLRTLVAPPDERVPLPTAHERFRRRIGLRRAARELWHARPLVLTLAERDLRVRYKQAVLGFAWALITPLGLLGAFVIVFHHAAHVATGGIPYALFAYIGLVPWTFFSTALNMGGNSLLADKGLLNKCYFPREVFPIAQVAVAMTDALMAGVPLAILFAVNTTAPGRWGLFAPALLLMLVVFATGVAFITSSVIVYLRDVRLALPLILQLGLFVTPVGYGLSVVPGGFRLAYCFLNPVAPVIDGLRRTLVLNESPVWSQFAAGAISTVICFAVGWALFKRLETGFADVA